MNLPREVALDIKGVRFLVAINVDNDVPCRLPSPATEIRAEGPTAVICRFPGENLGISCPADVAGKDPLFRGNSEEFLAKFLPE